MAALVADLAVVAPREAGQRRLAVVGILESKDHRPMLALLAAQVDELVITMPHVLAKPGASTASLAATVRALGFSGPIHVEPDPRMALEIACERASTGDSVLVTGSLFVVGETRGHWYDPQQIVEQQTPWPTN
jgi:folylpolyglutamate synthase/dihydropteroate synthase